MHGDPDDTLYWVFIRAIKPSGTLIQTVFMACEHIVSDPTVMYDFVLECMQHSALFFVGPTSGRCDWSYGVEPYQNHLLN